MQRNLEGVAVPDTPPSRTYRIYFTKRPTGFIIGLMTGKSRQIIILRSENFVRWLLLARSVSALNLKKEPELARFL
jgi:hypothetical protein